MPCLHFSACNWRAHCKSGARKEHPFFGWGNNPGSGPYGGRSANRIESKGSLQNYMETNRSIFLGILAASLSFGPAAAAQAVVRAAPTAADWTALAKRPDFTGVWETALPVGAGEAADEVRLRRALPVPRRLLLEAAHRRRAVGDAEGDKAEVRLSHLPTPPRPRPKRAKPTGRKTTRPLTACRPACRALWGSLIRSSSC